MWAKRAFRFSRNVYDDVQLNEAPNIAGVAFIVDGSHNSDVLVISNVKVEQCWAQLIIPARHRHF